MPAWTGAEVESRTLFASVAQATVRDGVGLVGRHPMRFGMRRSSAAAKTWRARNARWTRRPKRIPSIAYLWYVTMAGTGKVQRSDLVPGTLYILVLKTLARRGPLHGVGIAQFIADTTDGVLQVEEGSLYPTLQRMLIKGWVTAAWRQTENNRRARYYTFTARHSSTLRSHW
jgi:PadR family transcriptional regulator PadR